MVVGALKLTMYLGQSVNLKVKRKVMQSIRSRVQGKFNTAVAEVGEGWSWRKLELGFSVCSNKVLHVNKQLQEIVRFVECLALAEVIDVRLEIVNLKDMAWFHATTSFEGYK